MKNKKINLYTLCSGIGLFSLFLIFSGSELKADTLIPSQKKYVVSNRTKWVRYDESYKDGGIKFEKKESNEVNKKLITEVKNEGILKTEEVDVIDKVNKESNLTTTFFPQPLEGLNNIFVASKVEETESSALISEIIIEGWEDHPEGRKLELAAYDSMSIKPGSIVNNQILQKDLNAIYASGWFSGVKI